MFSGVILPRPKHSPQQLSTYVLHLGERPSFIPIHIITSNTSGSHGVGYEDESVLGYSAM
jgi:hypothetical protein